MPVIDKRLKTAGKKRNFWKSALLAFGSVALAAAGVMILRQAHRSAQVPALRFSPPSSNTFERRRQVFPYSIVAGGVHDPKELAQAIRNDTVARDHYQDIEVENMAPVRIADPMHAYVSYRIGDKIYWTTKKLTIPRGELVLTDGINMIRARCGNRISTKLAKSDVKSARQSAEPSEDAFDEPILSVPVVWPESQNGIAITPEPASLVLCGTGALLILGRAAWQRRQNRLYQERKESSELPA